MGKQTTIDYDFKAETPSRFRCILSFPIESRVMNMVFQKSKAKLASSKKINVPGDINEVSEIPIPPEYLNLMRTAAHSLMGMVKAEVKKDKIQVLRDKCTFAKFKKMDAQIWVVTIVVEGDYVEK